LSARTNPRGQKSGNTPKAAGIGLPAEVVALVCHAGRMPMLKTNITAFQIYEEIFSIEILLPMREAVTIIALWGCLFDAVIGQMPVKD
jgi:hypothetical protein